MSCKKVGELQHFCSVFRQSGFEVLLKVSHVVGPPEAAKNSAELLNNLAH